MDSTDALTLSDSDGKLPEAGCVTSSPYLSEDILNCQNMWYFLCYNIGHNLCVTNNQNHEMRRWSWFVEIIIRYVELLHKSYKLMNILI